MEKKHLSFETEFKALDDEQGRFEAYLSVFNNVDHGGDKVIPGAFAQSLKDRGSRLFPLLDQHMHTEVIGGFVATEDNVGLKIAGEFNLDTQKGREAYSNAKKGYLTGFSMGYITRDYEIEDDTRVLKRVDLLEGSIVTFPMNEAAQLTAIKSGESLTERQFEKFLRDAGFSRADAKIIIADGYKGYLNRREAGDDKPEEAVKEDLAPALDSLLSKTQELISYGTQRATR